MAKKKKDKRRELHRRKMDEKAINAYMNSLPRVLINRQELATQAGLPSEDAQKCLDVLEQEGLLKQHDDGSISVLI